MSRFIVNNNGDLTEICLNDTSFGLMGVRKIINEGEIVTIKGNYENLVYGDVIVDGSISGDGTLTIINGNLIIGNKGVVNLSKVNVIGFLERSEYEEFQNKLINDLSNYREILYLVNNYSELNNYLNDVINDDIDKIFITIDDGLIYYYNKKEGNWLNVANIDFSYNSINDFPKEGISGKIYVDKLNGILYNYINSKYVVVEKKYIIEINTQYDLYNSNITKIKDKDYLYITKDYNKLWRYDDTIGDFKQLNFNVINVNQLNDVLLKDVLYLYKNQLYINDNGSPVLFNKSYIEVLNSVLEFDDIFLKDNKIYITSDNNIAWYYSGGDVVKINNQNVIEKESFTSCDYETNDILDEYKKNKIYVTTIDNKLWFWDNVQKKYLNVGEKQNIFYVSNLLSLQLLDDEFKSPETIYCTEDSNYLYIYDVILSDFRQLNKTVQIVDSLSILQDMIGDIFTLYIVNDRLYQWCNNMWKEVEKKQIIVTHVLPLVGEKDVLYINKNDKTVWYFRNDSWTQIAGIPQNNNYFILRFKNLNDMLQTNGNVNVLYLVGGGINTKFYQYESKTKTYRQFKDNIYIFEVFDESELFKIIGFKEAIWIVKKNNKIYRYDNGWVEIIFNKNVIEKNTYQELQKNTGNDNVIYIDKSSNTIYRCENKNKYIPLDYKRVINFEDNITVNIEQKESIYVNVNNRKLYRWDDSIYTPLILDENVIIESTKENFTTNNIPLNTIFISKSENLGYVWDGASYIEVEKLRIIEFDNFETFPIVGEDEVVYIDKLNNNLYRYKNKYIPLGLSNEDEYVITVDNSLYLPDSLNPGVSNKIYITTNNNYLWRWDINKNISQLIDKNYINIVDNFNNVYGIEGVVYILSLDNSLWVFKNNNFSRLDKIEIVYNNSISDILEENVLYVRRDVNRIYYYLNNKINYINISNNNIVMVEDYNNIDEDAGVEKQKKSNVYVTNNNKIYRWNDVEYIELNIDDNTIISVDSYDDLLNLSDKKIGYIYIVKDVNLLYRWDGITPIKIGNTDNIDGGKHRVNNLSNKTFLYFNSDIYASVKNGSTATIVQFNNIYNEKWKPFLKPKVIRNYENDIFDFAFGGGNACTRKSHGLRMKGFTNADIDGTHLYLSQYQWGTARDFQGFKESVGANDALEPKFVSSWIPKLNLDDLKLNTFVTYDSYVTYTKRHLAKGHYTMFSDGKDMYLPTYARNLIRKVKLDGFPGFNPYQSTVSSAITLNHIGYGSSCTDGMFGYLLPYIPGNKSILKINLKNNEITELKLENVKWLISDNDFRFMSSFIYEGYLYAPTFESNKILKIDLNNFTPEGVDVLSILNTESEKGFCGICTDGYWLYLSPNGMIFPRILLKDFNTIQYINLTEMLKDNKIENNKYLFGCCVQKDRYVYYAPMLSKYILRIDKLNWRLSGVNTINTETLKLDEGLTQLGALLVINYPENLRLSFKTILITDEYLWFIPLMYNFTTSTNVTWDTFYNASGFLFRIYIGDSI